MKKFLQTITIIILTMQFSFAQEAFVESNQTNEYETALPSCSDGMFPYQYAANDVTVPADQNLHLTIVEPNFWIEVYSGATNTFIESADIMIYKDDNGLPGEELAIYEDVFPSHTEDLGLHGLYGDMHIVRLTFDIPELILEGQSGIETTYWVCVYTHLNYQSNEDGADWDASYSSTVGNLIAYSVDYGETWAHSGLDGIYNFKGELYPLNVGIAQIDDVLFDVYPNPASDQFTVTSVSDIQKVEMYNQVGQLVKHMSANSTSLNLKVAELESGIYFVKIYSSNQVITRKLVIE